MDECLQPSEFRTSREQHERSGFWKQHIEPGQPGNADQRKDPILKSDIGNHIDPYQQITRNSTGGGGKIYCMGQPPIAQVTLLLRRWTDGDSAALEELTPLVYGELRLLADGYLRRERPGPTLQPTELIHEAYMATEHWT